MTTTVLGVTVVPVGRLRLNIDHLGLLFGRV